MKHGSNLGYQTKGFLIFYKNCTVANIARPTVKSLFVVVKYDISFILISELVKI